MIKTFDFAGRQLDFSTPAVMGILNVTPDSFSDGGRFKALDDALRHGGEMLAEGAAIIDVGGESTRPGAAAVGEQQELDRVIPVIEALVREFDCIVSVDTSTAAVMSEAHNAGARLINDVRALRREGALLAAVKTGLPVCLMHMQGEPGTMQRAPEYKDVVDEVIRFLLLRAGECAAAGIAPEKIMLDPGFGFGKTAAHNLSLLKHFSQLSRNSYPVLAGLSRKSLIAQICDREVEQRLAGSIALAMLAMQGGAAILRVHDVAETVDAVKLFAATRAAD